MVSEHQVCLLLGSNIQPEHNLPLAIERSAGSSTILQISRGMGNPLGGNSGTEFPQRRRIGTHPPGPKNS